MMGDVRVLIEERITEDIRSAITMSLDTFTDESGVSRFPIPLCLSLREGDLIVGGLIGHTNRQWLKVEVIAVAMHLRRRGYGRKLMEMAEAIALTRGCLGVWVEAYSCQSLEFYRQLGYHSFGTLPHGPAAEPPIFLMKTF